MFECLVPDICLYIIYYLLIRVVEFAVLCFRYSSQPSLGLTSCYTSPGFCNTYTADVSLSFSYSDRANLIPIQRTCRSHSHTAVGLLSFPFVVSLSFSYSGWATLISIQRTCRSHSHTAVGLLSFPFVVSLSFFIVLCRTSSTGYPGLRNALALGPLSQYFSPFAGRTPRAVQVRDVGRSSPRPT